MNPIVWRLGWALLHFVWQGAAIAVIVAGLMWLLRRRSSNARYLTACAGMLAMAAIVAVTFGMLHPPVAPLGADPSTPSPTAPPPAARQTSNLTRHEVSGAVTARVRSAEPSVTSSQVTVSHGPPAATISIAAPPKMSPAPWPQRLTAACERYLPWMVGGWFLGMMALSLRLLAGWMQVQRIRRRLVQPAADGLEGLLADLSGRLRLHRRVKLLISVAAQVPMTIGWLRPVILLPASALTGLTPDQLRAIVAHELAHIRRYDYLVNILQSVVETLLFYHPAVWWVSHRIRAEREHCCDDVAVSVCGGSLLYARALAEMEQLRALTPQWAAAATGGSLVRRIHRLVGLPTPRQARSTRWLAGAIGLLVVAGCVAGYRASQGQEPPPSQPAATPVASEISGRVTDHTGQPVAGVRVYLTGPTALIHDGDRSVGKTRSEARTDANGQFTLNGAGPQTTGVAILAPRYATVLPLPERGQILSVRLPGPSTLTIHFDIPGAEPEAEFQLWGRDSIRAGPLSSQSIDGVTADHRGSLTVKVPNGGQATLTDLSAGTLSFARMKHFSGGDFGVRVFCDRGQLTVGFDQSLTIDAVRNEGQYIEGGLKDLPADSIGIAYVMVRPASAEEEVTPELRTLEAVAADATGQWKTPLIPPGQYVVAARVYRSLAGEPGNQRYRYGGVRGPDFEGTARVTVSKDAPPPRVQIPMQPAPSAAGTAATQPAPAGSSPRVFDRLGHYPLAVPVPATQTATQPADHAPQTSRPAETQSVNHRGGRVLLPDGQPAAGATVVLVLPDHQVRFENGRFIHQLHARTEKLPPGPTTTTTDSAGRFTLPAGQGLHPLVVTHESGYAEALLNPGQPIRLQPWGKVEGAMFPPDHPEPNPADVTLTAARPVGSSTLQDPQEILHTYEAGTDPDGNFRFDRVAPGRYWIRRKLSWMVTGDNPEIEVPAGSSQYIALYAPVRGRLVAAAGSGITITPDNTRLRIVAVTPYPAWSGSSESIQQAAEHYSRFIASREFQPFTRNVAVDVDGSFALPVLPTATYMLQAEVFKHPLSKAEVFEKPLVSVVFGQPLIHAGYNQISGVLKQSFTVPATQGRSPPPLVDLGLLPVRRSRESQ